MTLFGQRDRPYPAILRAAFSLQQVFILELLAYAAEVARVHAHNLSQIAQSDLLLDKDL